MIADHRYPYAGLRTGIQVRASDDHKGLEKSVSDQTAVGLQWIADQRAVHAGTYTENDISASRFGRKARDEFARLLADVRANKFDLIWFWKQDRQTRRLGVFADLRDACRKHGVRWVIQGRVYDLNDAGDRWALGIQAIQAEELPEQISENVSLGLASSAAAGLPHGPILYGYRRVYDPKTGDLCAVVIEQHEADIVLECADLLLRGKSPYYISEALNSRGEFTRRGSKWYPITIKYMLSNLSYIGKRLSHGRVVADAIWPPIFKDESDFFKCRDIILAMKGERPVANRYLLSGILRCGICAAKTQVVVQTWRGKKIPAYRCEAVGKWCAQLKVAVVDDWVTDNLLGWLEQPDALELLMPDNADEDVLSARTEVARLQGELAEWVELAQSGGVKPIKYAEIERGLLANIADAERRAAVAPVSQIVADACTPNIRNLWFDEDEYPLTRKRAVIRELLDIRLFPPGRGSWKRGFDPNWVQIKRRGAA